VKLDDEDKDLAQELLSSPGWRVLFNRIIHKKINDYSAGVYQHARTGDALRVAQAVAKRDAVFELIEAIYDASAFTMPENLKTLKRGD
jgi:high-affinity Fe2+/Pb2+ permease